MKFSEEELVEEAAMEEENEESVKNQCFIEL
jgi:hypothetical protein